MIFIRLSGLSVQKRPVRRHPTSAKPSAISLGRLEFCFVVPLGDAVEVAEEGLHGRSQSSALDAKPASGNPRTFPEGGRKYPCELVPRRLHFLGKGKLTSDKKSLYKAKYA